MKEAHAGRSAKCGCGAKVRVPQLTPEPDVVDDLWNELGGGDEYEVESPEEVSTSPGPNPYHQQLAEHTLNPQVAFETSRGVVVLDGLIYTSLIRRLLAAFIDISVCGMIFMAVFVPFMPLIIMTKNALWVAPVFLFGPVLSLLYLVMMDCSRWRASLGKQGMSSEVCYPNGEPVTLSTCVVRTIARFLTLFTGGLGFLTILFSKQNQALHDMIAGTVVTRNMMGEWDIFRRQRKQQRQ